MTRPEPKDAAARRLAVDATRSFLVEAPAGSGKTRLLVARYLELLKRVAHPEEILAITFTTKAAAEMRRRVLQALREDPTIRAVDQRRGWNLDTRPEQLKIQTIDSFALGLARRLPIASALCADHIAENGATLYEEAAWRVLERIAAHGADADMVADFVALLDNDADHARTFLAEALGKRDQWVAAVTAVAKSPKQVASSVAAGVARLRRAVTAHARAAVPPALWDDLETLGTFTAERLDQPWPGLDAPEGWRHLADVLLRKDGAPRNRFDARGGFPPRFNDEKHLARTTAQALEQMGLAAVLHQFRMLPARGSPPASDPALKAIAGALAFAVVDLNATFDARRTVDFAEFTVAAGRALADGDAPTELALALDYRIRHILVDEFQDTSFGQHRMLVALTRGWAGGGNTFFAVGDPMQSIYRFRNADLRSFLETAAHGLEDVPVERLRLTSNFRASAALVDWCNAVFQDLFGKDTDPIRGAVAFTAAHAENEAPGTTRTIICLGDPQRSGRLQGEVVAERVAELLRDGGRIAILARTRATLRDILPVLRERGIAWRGEDVELLANEPVVRDLQSLTVVLHDPADRLAWLALARSPMVGLDLVDLERVARNLPEVGAAQAAERCGEALSPQGRERWQRLATALRRGRRSLPPRSRVEQVWLTLGGPDAYQTDSAMPNAARFLGLLDADPALARHPAQLERALGQLFAADAASAQTAEAEVVEVMTIHKAKGLEFDHVIVPGLEQPSTEHSRPLLLWRREGEDVLIAPRTHRGEGSLYDWLAAEENANDANEVKRLFYVAATRAARSLTLVGALQSADAKPPEGSLLALVWSHEKQAAEFRENSPTAQSETTRRRTGRRLPAGYRFSPAVELPPVRPRARSRPVATEAGSHDAFGEARSSQGNEEADGARRNRALGDLVHRELRWLATAAGGAERFDVAERAGVWRVWLRALPVYAADAAWIEAELRRQITGVLADPRGRWILFGDQHGGNEAPFMSVLDGEPMRVVVDRTFVDDGVRWVVDYKTAPIAPGDEAALAAQRERHTPQLARYVRVLTAVDARPVRAALYFTALPRFEVVLESPTSGPNHALR